MANPRLLNGAASPQSVYETGTTRHHRVGARGTLDDRVFRYASLSNATGVVANNLCQGAIPTANHVTETGTLTGFTVGSTSFTAVLGATLAHTNMYAEGYIKIQSSTLGLGQIYKLRDHESVASAGTASFTTYDPIVTTPTGTVTWSLIQNPWADIIITPITTLTQIQVGVPLLAIPAASTTTPVYCWVQTWGICSVLGDTSDTVVGSAVIGSAVVGSVGVAVETDIKQRVGISMETLTTNTVHQTVFLQIAP